MQNSTMWNQITEAVRQPPRRTGLWAWLAAQVDLAQYRPQAAPGVEISHLQGREGEYYVIKNPTAKTYYRLNDKDYFLWQQMDGSKSIKELVVAFFAAYGSFAFPRVAALVRGLKANRFLVDQPAGVYQETRRQLEHRRPDYWLNSLWQAFMQRPFAIDGLDGIIGGVYRSGARLLYTRLAQILFIVVSVLGLVAFGRLIAAGGHNMFKAGGSVLLGVVSLIIANLVVIFVHEMGHALTVKHYGREVRQAGFMIYFGMPAFFVDTTDIWMEAKRGRLAVTWAGPYVNLVCSGLAAIALTLWPGMVGGDFLFQFAFLGYIIVFVNLNPLLQLDGYYLLMDWLEIPLLRYKSLSFLRDGLPKKFRRPLPNTPGRTRVALPALSAFSREERIFTVFGLLSAIWSVYAIYLAGSFWQRQLTNSVSTLLRQSQGFGQGFAPLMAALAGLTISLPFVLALGFAAFVIGRGILKGLARKGLFASNTRVAALLAIGAIVLTLALRWLQAPILATGLSLAALVVALIMAGRNLQEYAGSRLVWPFRLLGSLAAVLLALDVALAANVLSPTLAHFDELGLSLLALAALAWALIQLVGRGRTSFGPAWALICLGLASAFAAILPPMAPWRSAEWRLLGFLLLASGLFLHDLASRRLSLTLARPEFAANLDDAFNDAVRLQRAAGWMMAGILQLVGEIAGQRAERRVRLRLQSMAATAGWRITVSNEQLTVGSEQLTVSSEQLTVGSEQSTVSSNRTLGEESREWAGALNLLLNLTQLEIGDRLTNKTLQHAYDLLPWEEREIGAEVLLPYIERAAALSRDFRDTRNDYTALLRQMPLFASMNAHEVQLLTRRLKLATHPAGEVIIRQGEAGDRFYIVKQGEVEVSRTDARGVTAVVARLHRGDYFGELALLSDAPRNATCRALAPTQTVALSRRDFDLLVKERFALREKLDRSIAHADLLRHIPLFDELDGQQIQQLAAQLRPQEVEAGFELIRQGEQGDAFYIIEAGRMQVTIGKPGSERVVHELGPGEYVGEVALLHKVPRTATVRSLTPGRVLVLGKESFDQLVSAHLLASRLLERAASRHLVDARRAGLAAA